MNTMLDTPGNDNLDASHWLQPGRRRQRWGWYLVDFSVSILIINGGLYFPQWIVVDKGVSDLWFNVSIMCSSIAVLITAPIFGRRDDIAGRSLWPVIVTGLVMFVAALVIWALSVTILPPHITGGLALVAFAILMYAFQLTLVFYNAMLSKIATPENYARVSGLGFAWGWIGGILGIVGVLPFVNGTLPATSSSPRADAVLPSALLFGGLYVISLILMYHRGALSWAKSTGRVSQHNLIQPFREIWLFAKRNPTLKIFLASYILYADAVLTIQNNASIYLQQVMHFGDNAKAILFLLLLGGAAIGGYASFAAIGRFGLRIVMRGILVGWVTLAIAATVTYSKPLFVVLFACTGVLFGSLWNSSRVIFTNLVPIRWGGQYFGLYSSFDRLATLLGPLLWSAPLVVIGDTTATPYRISMALIAALLLASLVVFWRIKSLHKDTA